MSLGVGLARRQVVPAACFTIVAALACHVQRAAADDVPVPGGMAAVASMLGIPTVPERSLFVAEVTRLTQENSLRRISMASRLVPLRERPSFETVPVPLTASWWSSAVFRRPVTTDDLLLTILGDPRASFLCRALSALDDETLAYFEHHPRLATSLYERDASIFAAFGWSLRIHNDRVVPPGGDQATALWEATLAEPASEPERFVPALLAHDDGRLAYLYSVVAQLDPSRARFALGLWRDSAAERVGGMKAFVGAWASAFRDWHIQVNPFARPMTDPATLLSRVKTDADGVPIGPNGRSFWSHAFESNDVTIDSAKVLAASPDARPIDAVWLIRSVEEGDARQRIDRADQFAFVQRVFASASPADLPDELVAVRAFPRYRMLLLTLERMGISKPATYVAAVRQVSRFVQGDAVRAFDTTIGFEGAVALLQRLEQVGTLTASTAEQLVVELASLPVNERGDFGGGLVRWLDVRLRPALPREAFLETAIVAGLAGPTQGDREQRIEWEGEPYRFDPASWERQRLQRARSKQAAPPIDAVVDLEYSATMLAGASLTLAQAEALLMRLQAAFDAFPAPGGYTDYELPAPGLIPLRELRGTLEQVIDVVRRSIAAKDPKRIPRGGVALLEAADNLCAQTLVALAYAVNLGNPDGPAFVASDVSRRHDFGFASRDSEVHLRAPWMLPRQNVGPGVPWHVDGSILGLDVALASLALERLRVTDALPAPTLNTNVREMFATNVSLIDPRGLSDSGRAQVLAAIDRGRARLSSFVGNLAAFDEAAEEIGLDGWRRRAGHWTLTHEPGTLESMFSLLELGLLGDPSRAVDFRPWGTSAIVTAGCLCLDAPLRWQVFTGRPQLGIMAVAVLDLHLHVARLLQEMALPARLEKYVLGPAAQDFVDEVRPADPDDWLTLMRAGRTMSRERLEDYVAAAAATGPLVPAAVQ